MNIGRMAAAAFAAALFGFFPLLSEGEIPDNYQLIYEQNFDRPEALNDFVFANPDNWSVTRHDGNGALTLTGESGYAPPVTSPLNIALLVWRRPGDFILECDLLQTGRDYGHRDMCVFFGFQSPEEYYYTHLASQTDEHAHNILIVKGEARRKISEKTTSGVEWGREEWHRVRVERDAGAGSIRVFFDDMDRPVMTAVNTDFPEGWIGFGSFDDTGMVDNIRLWAPGEPKAWRPRCFPSKPVYLLEDQPDIEGPGFVSLFDGKTLKGWKPLNGTARYFVEEGCIVGECDPEAELNTYLSTEESYGDFLFACDVRFDALGNSGIQIRSRQRPGDGLVTGYQIEIDHQKDRRWSGGLYEERGRDWMTPLVGEGHRRARAAFDPEGWNTMVIRARGSHIQTWVNGVPIADYFDNDEALSAREGFIGLQVHWPVTPEWQGRLRWRNLRIKELGPGD